MSNIVVIRAGLLTTIQDGGRHGWQLHGVPVSGPMDPFSFRTANLLVGNEPDEAALEVTLLGPELRFDEDAVVAVAGADLSASIATSTSHEPLGFRVAVDVPAGAVLRFGDRRRHARAYLGVRGGLDVPVVLGSRSTSLQAALPGLAGRAVRTGDTIPIGRRAKKAPTRAWPAGVEETTGNPVRVRFIWGPDDDLFSDAEKSAFLGATYRLATASNRMGYRLEGASVRTRGAAQVLSEATPMGSIQVPPSGEPILLMADRQTTGGYPRIGTVITADLALAGQLAPGEPLAFVPCEPGEAVAALRARESAILEIGGSR